MILKKGNVERVTENADTIAKLKKEGFKTVEKRQIESGEVKAADDLDSMKLDELRNYAKGKGIEGYSGLTKAELLTVLKEVV